MSLELPVCGYILHLFSLFFACKVFSHETDTNWCVTQTRPQITTRENASQSAA